MGTLTVASFVGFKTEPQYLFVRVLAFCDPWLQLADEPKIEKKNTISYVLIHLTVEITLFSLSAVCL